MVDVTYDKWLKFILPHNGINGWIIYSNVIYSSNIIILYCKSLLLKFNNRLLFFTPFGNTKIKKE